MNREEAREVFEHNWTRIDNPDYTEDELVEAMSMAIQALSERTGEWVDKGDWQGIECSRCNCHSRYVTPFCPQCGARMHKGGEDE